MSFQFIQIIQLLIYVILGVLIWKFKNTKFRIVLVILALVIFLINPVRFKQEGMSKIERRANKTQIILPDRIIIEKKSFEEKQTSEMNKLKNKSKEIVKDEIN